MMLTVKQVAALLNISATCVYQLVATGRLPNHRIGVGRGAIRIDDSDLLAYLDRSRVDEADHQPPRVETKKRSEFKQL
jgi:excisionase family DNA binding protein